MLLCRETKNSAIMGVLPVDYQHCNNFSDVFVTIWKKGIVFLVYDKYLENGERAFKMLGGNEENHDIMRGLAYLIRTKENPLKLDYEPKNGDSILVHTKNFYSNDSTSEMRDKELEDAYDALYLCDDPKNITKTICDSWENLKKIREGKKKK